MELQALEGGHTIVDSRDNAVNIYHPRQALNFGRVKTSQWRW